jgi:quercetin dioxygenase-like cupin family protein
MKGSTAMAEQNAPLYVPADTGPSFWGPGDRYTFLVTGAQSDNAYFIMEALVPPEGGPPPHIHRREHESFYVLAGEIEFRLEDKVVVAGAGDFVHVPCGKVHAWRNSGSETARLLITFSPSGMEHFFLETLEQVEDRNVPQPENMDDVVARYVEAAPRHGLEFI